MTTNFFTAVQSLGSKIKTALQSGNRVDCSEEIRGSATAAMTAFQTLLNERLKFIEILGGKSSNQSRVFSDEALAERCTQLEKEKLDLLKRLDETERNFQTFKEQNSKTVQLIEEISLQRTKLENFSLRFERLAGYDKSKIEDLLDAPSESTNCTPR